MFQNALLGLTVAAMVASAAAVVGPTATAESGRRILRRCGADEARFATSPDADWTLAASADAQHVALRKALDEPMPVARSMVRIHAIGGDLATTEYSVVLTRGKGGTWSGTAVGQSKVWIEGAKPSVMARRAWILPADKGHRLDALLADKCFYAEPTTFHRNQVPGVGVLFIDLETQTPRHQRRVSYKGGIVEGLTKEVTELTFPPAT